MNKELVHTERAGLYIMVFLCMVSSCVSCDNTDNIDMDLTRIERKIDALTKGGK